MEQSGMLDRLIFAVLRKEDYDVTTSELNGHGFFVTKLSSSGGFLKKENVTVMIGVEENRLPEAIDILKSYAGHRQATTYVMPTPGSGSMYANAGVPVEMKAGGVTIFTMKLEGYQKL